MGHPDTRVAAIAARQHGVVASRQLAAIGIRGHAVTNRVKHGRLHPIHRGVFAVGHTACTDKVLLQFWHVVPARLSATGTRRPCGD